MNPEVQQYIESRIKNVGYRKERPTIELWSVEFSRVAALTIVVYNKGRKPPPRAYIHKFFVRNDTNM